MIFIDISNDSKVIIFELIINKLRQYFLTLFSNFINQLIFRFKHIDQSLCPSFYFLVEHFRQILQRDHRRAQIVPGYSAGFAFEMGASERIFAFGVDTKTGDIIVFGAYNIGRVLFDRYRDRLSRFTHLRPDVQ